MAYSTGVNIDKAWLVKELERIVRLNNYYNVSEKMQARLDGRVETAEFLLEIIEEEWPG